MTEEKSTDEASTTETTAADVEETVPPPAIDLTNHDIKPDMFDGKYRVS